MAEKLSIKERIERELVRSLQTIDDITVSRWDARTADGNNLSCVLIAEDEEVPGGTLGLGEQSSTTEKTMILTAQLLVAQAPKRLDSASSSQVHNRWLARLEAAIMGNSQVTETGTGVNLAIDTQVVGTSNPPTEDDQPEFFTILAFEVNYEHYRNDPYSGPGIPEAEG